LEQKCQCLGGEASVGKCFNGQKKAKKMRITTKYVKKKCRNRTSNCSVALKEVFRRAEGSEFAKSLPGPELPLLGCRRRIVKL
jgi:hypothetical protein